MLCGNGLRVRCGTLAYKIDPSVSLVLFHYFGGDHT